MDLTALISDLISSIETLEIDITQAQEDVDYREGIIRDILSAPDLEFDCFLEEDLYYANEELASAQGIYTELEQKIILLAKILLKINIDKVQV